MQYQLVFPLALVLLEMNVPLGGGASTFFRTGVGFFSSGMSFLGTSGTLKILFVFNHVFFYMFEYNRHEKESRNT